jgi:hypothetical protein
MERCLWGLLLAVLAINVPAFLCMGPDPDVSQWDFNTRTVLSGGTIYRDSFENNLPGMLLPLVVVRSLLGYRSEVLRLADLVIVLVITWQLTRWLPGSASRPQRLILACVLLVFYLSTSEWCHCQRDTWMLLPALAAVSLRWRQVARLSRPDSTCRPILPFSLLEGLLWGGAFWIKPFVAVPALLCWLLSARLARPSCGGRRVALDAAALLAGGIVAGVAGCAWLVGTGTWPAFAEIVFVWNREYAGRDLTEGQGWLCLAGLVYRLIPWVLVHLIAVPLALGQVWRAVTVRRHQPDQPADLATQTLLAGFYLGWLFQSVFLQHLFDYVHVPAVLLGLTVVAGQVAVVSQQATRRLVVVALAVCVLVRFPALCVDRLTVWGDCVRHGSTPELRDRLTLLPKESWTDLDRVTAFLRDQGVSDGEVSCTHMGTISAYEELGVRPATRFAFLLTMVLVFQNQHDSISSELTASRQRFLICDVKGYGMDRWQEALAGKAPYPWANRVVFRSGRYVVFRLSGAETWRWLEETGNQ